MDNEYNYYEPENEGSGTYREEMIFDEPKKEKPKKKMPKSMKILVIALVAGILAGGGFAGTNFLVGKALGTNGSKSVSTSQKSVAESSGVKLNQSSSTVTSDVSSIVDETMPSVVSITNMSVQEVMSFFGGVQQQESQSCGSGIIVGQNDTELLIVTNNHVVEGANTLTVSFVDEQSVEANIKGTDATKDLAVVSVPLSEIPDETMDQIKSITLGDSSKLQVGEPVIAIGNALGYGQSVTSGIVSALNRDLEMEGFDSKLIQTDAAINPGNSGGALLNANGELVGINTVKVNANAVEGMGYAIPISDASEVITTLMNKETREKVDEKDRGLIGIKGVDVTSESSEMYNMPVGVYVSEVIEGGGAEKAGLTKGNIITKFDGTTIDSMSTLQEQLQYYRAGEKVDITVQVPDNSGEYTEQNVTLTLGKDS